MTSARFSDSVARPIMGEGPNGAFVRGCWVLVLCLVVAPLRARAEDPRHPDRPRAPLRDIDALPTGSRDDIAAARLQVLADARYQLSIRLPLLDNQTLASKEELAELRRIAISGRHARIRILLHDPAAALRSDHRLVALAQRLSSAIEIRMPVDEVDLASTSSFVLNDVGGYLFLPEADRAQGRAARDNRPAQAPLQQQFDEVWDRSERASVLQPLDL